ncbi:MAG: threonine/serine exporter family protein [Acidobacteriota bacterium]
MTKQPSDFEGARRKELVVRLGSALHRFGAPAHRLELALENVSRRLGLEANFLSTPTSLISAFEEDGERTTILERLEVGSVDLHRIGALDELAGQIARGDLSTAEAFSGIEELERQPSFYSAMFRVLASGLATSTAAVILGGGATEVLLTLITGIVVGVFFELGAVWKRLSRLVPVASAFLVAMLCGWVQNGSFGLELLLADGFSVPTVLVASLITLVPGLGVTVSVSELAQGSLVSGSARLFGAVLVFLMLGFGVALGSGASALEIAETGARSSLPLWMVLLCVAVSGLSFVVLFNAAAQDVPWIVAIGLLTFLVTRLSTARLGLELGTFAGAFAVGLLSNLFSRITGRPAMIPRVPAVFLLVPGALGFRSVSSMLEQDAVAGVQLGFTVGLVAVAIVTGLLVANALVRPRWEL